MKQEHLDLAVQLRHELHRHPEVSMQEAWTKARLMEFLRQHTGLEIVDCGVWFYALYRSGVSLPAVAFRADMDALATDEDDALPYASQCAGAAHKCGHDGHSAALAALALELDAFGARRDVYLVFQPGEETGEGAKQCIAEFEQLPVAEIYAWHNLPGLPRGAVAVRDGTMCCASAGVRLRFDGAAAHASQPENGKNPAPAMAALLAALPAVAESGSWKGLVLCTVVHLEAGEKTFGSAAGWGEVWLTCRAEHENELDALLDAVREEAARQAGTHGLAFRCTLHEVFPETANHPENAETVRTVCRAAGVPLADFPKPLRSSEDFGYFLQARPGALFLLGAGDAPALHTAGFDFDDGLIEPAVELLKALAAHTE